MTKSSENKPTSPHLTAPQVDGARFLRLVGIACLALVVTIVVGKLSLTGPAKDVDTSLYDSLIVWLQDIPGLRAFSETATRMGSLTYNRYAALIAGVVFGLWRRNLALGILIAFAMLGAQAFQEITKYVVDGTRPAHELLVGDPGPYFSGGVQRVILMTGLVLFPLRNSATRVREVLSERTAWILAACVGGIEALTRMVLGVHWPIDLVAAFPIGLVLLWLIKQLIDMVDPQPGPSNKSEVAAR